MGCFCNFVITHIWKCLSRLLVCGKLILKIINVARYWKYTFATIGILFLEKYELQQGRFHNMHVMWEKAVMEMWTEYKSFCPLEYFLMVISMPWLRAFPDICSVKGTIGQCNNIFTEAISALPLGQTLILMEGEEYLWSACGFSSVNLAGFGEFIF